MALSVLISGCTTAPQLPKPIPATQIIAQLCPLTSEVNQLISALPDVNPDALKNIAAAQPIVSVVCASGGVVTQENINLLSSVAIPAILSAVTASQLPSDKIEELKIGIFAAQAILIPLVTK